MTLRVTWTSRPSTNPEECTNLGHATPIQGRATGDSIPGVVLAVWEEPHAMGYTHREVRVRHQDIPELVELLMQTYVDGEKRKAQNALLQMFDAADRQKEKETQ